MTSQQKETLKRITQKKKELDALRPLPKELEKNLYDWFKVALTYASNAIEGNTLSLPETAQVVEKQLTIDGKTVTEHLEALNHAQAIDVIQALAQKKKDMVSLEDILTIHKIILQKINDDWAGRFRKSAVRVVGSLIPCPNYAKVPDLMDELVSGLNTDTGHLATAAARAHLELAGIHPFVDGNGRTARLLMNLLLLQKGYPLVIIDAKDRKKYIASIQKALQGEPDDYYNFIYQAIERSLDEYLKAAHESEL